MLMSCSPPCGPSLITESKKICVAKAFGQRGMGRVVLFLTSRIGSDGNQGPNKVGGRACQSKRGIVELLGSESSPS